MKIGLVVLLHFLSLFVYSSEEQEANQLFQAYQDIQRLYKVADLPKNIKAYATDLYVNADLESNAMQLHTLTNKIEKLSAAQLNSFGKEFKAQPVEEKQYNEAQEGSRAQELEIYTPQD